MAKIGRPFEPGNKFGRGRPAGSRNKTALITRNLEENAPALLSKSMEMALEGNPLMLRALLGYILPPPKDPPVKTGPLRMGTIEELVETHKSLTNKVSSGQLSLDEAQQIDSLIESRRQLVLNQDLERRIKALEQFLEPNEAKAA
jgi:hypothetical protein